MRKAGEIPAFLYRIARFLAVVSPSSGILVSTLGSGMLVSKVGSITVGMVVGSVVGAVVGTVVGTVVGAVVGAVVGWGFVLLQAAMQKQRTSTRAMSADFFIVTSCFFGFQN